jgi:hypothetical protein
MKPRCPNARWIVPLALAFAAAACTRNPYFIGSVCPAADTSVDVDPRCATISPTPDGGTPDGGMTPDGGATFVVDLAHSGTSLLGPLPLASGPVQPTLWLRGEHATATGWPAEGGGTLGRGAGLPVTGMEAPFNDGTAAVGLPADAAAYVAADVALGAAGMDDFALEIVLRAAPGATIFSKSAGAVGWSLRTNAGGQLVLALGDGDATHAVEIASSGLTAGAWYHCLFWASRAAGGQAFCDGQAGTLVTLPALATLDAPAATLAAGGGAAVRVADLALFRVAAGGLGAAPSWPAVASRRFVTVAGAYPRVAGVMAAPVAGIKIRESEAYLDLQAVAGAARRLFLVGADWPRVACRTDVNGKHGCGYLSETQRTRLAPGDASAWQAAGVTLAPSAVLFADGEPRMTALIPSMATTTHTLSFTGTLGGARQVFSFFVHRDGAARVGASVGTIGTAVFDLVAVTASSPTAKTSTTIEPWGGDLFRCTYAFDPPNGPTTYSVRLQDAAGAETFAGTGAAAVEIAGLQVDVDHVFAASLLGADMQPSDRLIFAAVGNLPPGPSTTISASVMLPAGTRLIDEAIVNINHGGSFEDQVQLFMRGDKGLMKFWGLHNNLARWSFDGASVVDGAQHDVVASWNATSALLLVDGVGMPMPVMAMNPAPVGLDQIDVGFSESSSGWLEGLVSGLQIGAM